MPAKVSFGAKAGLLALLAMAGPLDGSSQTHTERPSVGARIAAHALDQTTWGTVYFKGYVRIRYPNGDLPRTRGVCTDVVVRALRSVGYDLQKLIHEDAKAHPKRYPRIQRLDPNIDHRRCPNQIAFFRRKGESLPIEARASEKSRWRAGDIVFWKLDNGLDHVGVLASKRNAQGWPLVIHNIGFGTVEEDVLFEWKLVGRYRFPK